MTVPAPSTRWTVTSSTCAVRQFKLLLPGGQVNFDGASSFTTLPVVLVPLPNWLVGLAGAAGMVNSMISGVAGESARGATGGFQSDLATRARANAASVGQAAYGKAMASQGFALQSLGYSIAGAEQSMAQAELGAMNGSLSRQGASMSAEQRVKAANLVAAAAQMGAAIAGNPRGGGGSGGGGGDGDGGGAPFKAGIALGQAFQAYAAGSDNLEASRQIGMQSQANDIAGFKAGQTANQLGIAGRNMDRMADFSAQSAAWHTGGIWVAYGLQ